MLTALQHGGFNFDFINARRLQEAFVDGPYLRAGPMRYRILVLPDVEAIDQPLSSTCGSSAVLAAWLLPVIDCLIALLATSMLKPKARGYETWFVRFW